MALASLVSFQEQEQKHKSDYELAKARVFLKANTHDSPNYQESSFGKSKSGNRGGNKQIFFMSLVDTR